MNRISVIKEGYVKNTNLDIKRVFTETSCNCFDFINIVGTCRCTLRSGCCCLIIIRVFIGACVYRYTHPHGYVCEPPKAVVSAALVKQLREETGAGMMDCKKALSETGGDLEKAQEYLRKKGLSTAEKKSSRLAAEGRIGSYIHDSRIGVLIEVNCETDFVGRSQNFKELVDDLAMQVVACPQVQYVSIEDIPESIINKEKELEMQREDLQSKPENIREKIVEGRVTKRLGELALLEQPFIKNDSMLVKDLVKQTVAALGENIKVRRFVRFTLGETTSENEKNDKNEA
ncbi:hypothetical protein CDL12_19124 [Handroanthus impetiginosus]|uniref:Elongation factor Ts, mitochondrial n=1 Tax=Handroanthus impetiginosus TaxID=429701 RepID=A0A2G9GSQ8_9LAMI|nr:hypothetical protein CDL12_19124 [Handroanthus impetiginosus]